MEETKIEEKKVLPVEPVKEVDPVPIQEPDKTTIDLEPDTPAVSVTEAIVPDQVTSETINAIIRKAPLKRAEAFINPTTNEKRVFIYAEHGQALKIVGHFEVTRN